MVSLPPRNDGPRHPSEESAEAAKDPTNGERDPTSSTVTTDSAISSSLSTRATNTSVEYGIKEESGPQPGILNWFLQRLARLFGYRIEVKEDEQSLIANGGSKTTTSQDTNENVNEENSATSSTIPSFKDGPPIVDPLDFERFEQHFNVYIRLQEAYASNAGKSRKTAGQDQPGCPDTAILVDEKTTVHDENTMGPDRQGSLAPSLFVDEDAIIYNEELTPVGRITHLLFYGYKISADGKILDNKGNHVGRCEILPEYSTRNSALSSPFKVSFLKVDEGAIIYDQYKRPAGRLIGLDLYNYQVTEHGNFFSNDPGNKGVVGRCEFLPESTKERYWR
jgi:hypothetical protein